MLYARLCLSIVCVCMHVWPAFAREVPVRLLGGGHSCCPTLGWRPGFGCHRYASRDGGTRATLGLITPAACLRPRAKEIVSWAWRRAGGLHRICWGLCCKVAFAVHRQRFDSTVSLGRTTSCGIFLPLSVQMNHHGAVQRHASLAESSH